MTTCIYSLKKRALLALTALLISSPFGFAQTIEDSTVFENMMEDMEPLLTTDIPYSSFGGITTDIITLNNQTFICPGISLGMIFNHHILVGGYAGFLFNHKKLQLEESKPLNLKYEHGGVWLGYITDPIKNIRFGLSTKIGKGDLELEDLNEVKYRNKNIFVAIPQLDIHITITRWMRVNLSTGYRVTSDLNLQHISSHYLNGNTTTIGIVFGECSQGYCF